MSDITSQFNSSDSFRMAKKLHVTTMHFAMCLPCEVTSAQPLYRNHVGQLQLTVKVDSNREKTLENSSYTASTEVVFIQDKHVCVNL